MAMTLSFSTIGPVGAQEFDFDLGIERVETRLSGGNEIDSRVPDWIGPETFIRGIRIGWHNQNTCFVSARLAYLYDDARTQIGLQACPPDLPEALQRSVSVDSGFFVTGVAACQGPNQRSMAGVRLISEPGACVLGEPSTSGIFVGAGRDGAVTGTTPTVAEPLNIDCSDTAASVRVVETEFPRCQGNWQAAVACPDGFVAVGFTLDDKMPEDAGKLARQVAMRSYRGIGLVCKAIRRPAGQ